MCESYARSLLRVSVAQICQALGWDAVQVTACNLLSDVLHRYIQQLARSCHRYSELYGRTDPVLDDVSQAFRLLGVNLGELEDYVHNLEPVAFAHQTPLFPVSKNNLLQFPQPGARDAVERKEYIPDYMPPLVSLQEEEEEEEVLADMGTSAEAMQVPLEEDEVELDEDETVNDENHPLKRHLDSPDSSMGMMPSKRSRMYPGFSPEWAGEPREPLSSLNPQCVPPGILPSHDSLAPLSPEVPSEVIPPFRPLPTIPKHSDQKGVSTPGRRPKVSSPGRQRTKSPKGVLPAPVGGSPIHSPKPAKERKKSPGRTKSPKSPKSPKVGSAKASQPPMKTETLHKLPLSALSERMGKENIHMRVKPEDREAAESPFAKPEPENKAIDDSIDAVIARACAEREPDPFAFCSGSDSDSNGFSSPRRLTIMEPATPKALPGMSNSIKDASTPLHLQANAGLGNWTMDDSINEVIRKVNQGGPSAPPPNQAEYVSSGSASPPTPEPLLKAFEEKNKPVPSIDIKKKMKKELKTKRRDKIKEFSKDGKMAWNFGLKDDELFAPLDFSFADGAVKVKPRDGDASKKDKDKKDKGKDRSKEDRQKQPALAPFALAEVAPLFSPSACLQIPSMLPHLAPLLHDKNAKNKLRLDKAKPEAPSALPSPVIPRLTLRVGGQDKIQRRRLTPSPPSAYPSAALSARCSRIRTPERQRPGPPRPRPDLGTSPGKTPVRSVVTETVSAYVIRDEWGNQIWICPGCNKPDDGSPMIGCDDCDDWYHWACVRILAAPPEDQQWFCIKCSGKKKDKKHKKRKHKLH
uniref:Transcription initiation factor TFIID subunit 3 n=1 Tax=Tetraodon nigroviridis TaxID=99883 RepID=H3DF03_TETNG